MPNDRAVHRTRRTPAAHHFSQHSSQPHRRCPHERARRGPVAHLGAQSGLPRLDPQHSGKSHRQPMGTRSPGHHQALRRPQPSPSAAHPRTLESHRTLKIARKETHTMPLAYLESQIDDLRAQAERVQNQSATPRQHNGRRNPHGHRKANQARHRTRTGEGPDSATSERRKLNSSPPRSSPSRSRCSDCRVWPAATQTRSSPTETRRTERHDSPTATLPKRCSLRLCAPTTRHLPQQYSPGHSKTVGAASLPTTSSNTRPLAMTSRTSPRSSSTARSRPDCRTSPPDDLTAGASRSTVPPGSAGREAPTTTQGR